MAQPKCLITLKFVTIKQKQFYNVSLDIFQFYNNRFLVQVLAAFRIRELKDLLLKIKVNEIFSI